MSEEAKTERSCGEHSRGAPWYPLRTSGHLFSQDVVEPGDPWRTEVVLPQRSLAAWSWYTPTPLFVPHISGTIHPPSQKPPTEQYTWSVSLDVAHFSPSEISLSVKDGFLEIGGRHEERPDQLGLIARCFTRRYRLPADTDTSGIVSSFSVDGILTVEAPVPRSSVPAAIIIPIKVEVTGTEAQNDESLDLDSVRAPSAEDHGEASPLEVCGDQAHPGSGTAGLKQRDERREEEEETHEEPAGESHPSELSDGEGTKSLHDSTEQHESLESKESPDTDASQQLESEEAAVAGEAQVAAEEITQPQEPDLGRSPTSEVQIRELEAQNTE